MLMYIGVRLIHVILHVPAGAHVLNAKFQPPFVYLYICIYFMYLRCTRRRIYCVHCAGWIIDYAALKLSSLALCERSVFPTIFLRRDAQWMRINAHCRDKRARQPIASPHCAISMQARSHRKERNMQIWAGKVVTIDFQNLATVW